MASKRPDYTVKVRGKKKWHRVGVARMKIHKGMVSVVLDIGVPFIVPPGTKLKLVQEEGD